MEARVISVSNNQREEKNIALPHASVFLVRKATPSTPVASALTDLSGRFIIKTGLKGLFLICIEAEGFSRTCEKEVSLDGHAQAAGTLRLDAPTDKRFAAVFGSVKLQDGKLARGFALDLKVNSYPIVEMTAFGMKLRAYVNNFGEYVLPQIPIKTDFELRVSIDGEVAVRRIKAITPLEGMRAYPIGFVLPTSAPQLRLLSATKAGKPVQVATPGDTITLHAVATDRDKDKLSYRWSFSDGAASSPTDTAEVQWKLPTKSGRYSATVMVSDGRGGYVREGLAVIASTGGARFSGAVLNQANQPIGGALVQVNGRVVNANSKGWFSLTAPVADRYVMNIRRAGVEAPGQPSYGTASYIYKAPVQGGRYVLRGAQMTTVDPTQPIVLQQQRPDCVGTGTSRIDWKPYLTPGVFQWQDGRGEVRSLRDLGARDPKSVQNALRLVAAINPSLIEPLSSATGVKDRVETFQPKCGPGIKVEIPPNSLIDPATQKAPTGNVQVAVSSVSLTAPDQMPGDYSVLDGGKTFGMESFGAGSIEIGSGASRYNLKPGATATVTIPVDATQINGRAKLQAEVPLLYYDEQQGYWQSEGTAKLVGTGASAAYVIQAKHFSTLNADILKSGQACVAVEVDPTAGFTLPFDVEVVMQPSVVNPGVIQVRTLHVDSTKSNVIYNLPNNKDIVLTPIISGTLPDGSTGNIPAGVFVVNTGGPQTSAVTPPPANADGTYYAESGGSPTGPCAARVTLRRLDPVAIASQHEYLQGLYMQATNIDEFAAVADQIEQGTRDYYGQADPRQLRNSLNLFKSKNRFGLPLAPGEVEYDAQYANSGDLGFGRDMHCRRNIGGDSSGGTVHYDYACYVTNFGQPPANLPDQQDANDVVDPLQTPDATVAMEYSRVENPLSDPTEFPDDERAVKFYVYNTNAPDTAPQTKADLDGHPGARPVPQLCQICHGGNSAAELIDPANPNSPKKGAFTSRGDIFAMGSNFLPFDLHLFNFPTTKSKASQQGAFRNLNLEIVRGVAAATGTGGDIVEVIDTSFYPPGAATTDQQEETVIAGWEPGNPNSNRHRFYQNVYARACRACHTAGGFAAPHYTTFTDFENDITNVQNRVCNQKVMPHAKRTNDIFWTSLNPNMAAFLEVYGQTLPGWSPSPGSQCGQFYQDNGGVVPSVFASQIYPILVSQCSGCHSATGLANWRVGVSIDDTYNTLINNLTKDGTQQYIVPNNPGASRLYQRITTGGVGTRMPQNGVDLVVTDTDTPPDGVNDAVEILAWINAGAPGP